MSCTESYKPLMTIGQENILEKESHDCRMWKYISGILELNIRGKILRNKNILRVSYL